MNALFLVKSGKLIDKTLVFYALAYLNAFLVDKISSR